MLEPESPTRAVVLTAIVACIGGASYTGGDPANAVPDPCFTISEVG